MKITKPAGYLAAIAILSIFSLLVYAAVQQSYRNSANDPQIQITRDMSETINSHLNIDHFLTMDRVDISKSLSVFNVLYDSSGHPLSSTGILEGSYPKLPKGIFEVVKKGGEKAFTWQPREGVRIAMVVKSVRSPGIAFVASGRSLDEIEKRVSDLFKMVFTGWILGIAVLLFYWMADSFLGRTKPQD